MYATPRAGFSKVSGISGLLISLAVVVSGNAALAEGLTGVTALSGAGGLTASMFGNVSAADLENYDSATAAAATASRLAALGVSTTNSVTSARKSALDAAIAARIDDKELFPNAARVLPLIVSRPGTEAAIGQTVVAPRPGVAQPVGVSRASLRPRTLAEKAAR